MSISEFMLSTFGGAAMALVTLAYFGRQLIRTQITKVLDANRAQLQVETTKEIDRHRAVLGRDADLLKSEITVHAHEKTTAITRLDAQRSEAVLATWNALEQWQDVVHEIKLQKNSEDFGKLEAQLEDVLDNVGRVFRGNSLFFDNDEVETVVPYIDYIVTISQDFVNDRKHPSQRVQTLWSRCNPASDDEESRQFNQCRNVLVTEFRKILSSIKESG